MFSSPKLQVILHCMLFALQFLRQLLDAKVMCTGERPFEWKTVEGLSVISAMSHSEHCSVENRNISARLLVSWNSGMGKIAEGFSVATLFPI